MHYLIRNVSLIVLPVVFILSSGCASTLKQNTPTPSPVGEWSYIIPNTPQGEASGTLTIVSQGEGLGGKLYIDIFDQTVPISEAKYTESRLSFMAILNAGEELLYLTTQMTLDNDSMTGTVRVEGIGEFDINAVRGKTSEQKFSAEDWRLDLQDLVHELSNRHVDLYHSVSRDSFEQAVAELDQRIPTLSESQILVELAQLVALIGDGHTSFFPSDQRGKTFRYFPIRLWSFSGDIYVIAASEDFEHVLGKRLTHIDSTPIDEAFSKVSSTIGADNDIEYIYTAPFELRRPELLYALGISKSPNQAAFKFEAGDQVTFYALTGKKSAGMKWRSANTLFAGQTLPTLRLDYLFATSLTLEHVKQRHYYWFTYLEEHQALYFQYNTCWDQNNRPSFEEVTRDIFQYMTDHPVERLIVDIRQNSGGEPLTAQPLIDGLAQRSDFTQAGRLFVLVGRRTFSAALTNAAQLRSIAGARIVGEPPRGKPNNPSEGRDIALKRTKILATVSTQFVERDLALGDAQYLPVDIEATHSFGSYQMGQDPVLEAALNAELFALK